MWRQFSRPSNPGGQFGFTEIVRRQLYWWAIKDISTAHTFVHMLITVPNDKWRCFKTTGSGLATGMRQFPGPVKSTYTRQIKALSIHQINHPSARLWMLREQGKQDFKVLKDLGICVCKTLGVILSNCTFLLELTYSLTVRCWYSVFSLILHTHTSLSFLLSLSLGFFHSLLPSVRQRISTNSR